MKNSERSDKTLKKTTITKKIYLLFILLWLVFVALFIIQFIFGRATAIRLTREYNERLFREISQILIERFERNGDEIQSIADLFSQMTFSDDEKLSIMKTFLDNNVYFSSIYYGENTGHMLNADGWHPYEGYDLTVRPWYTGAIESGKAFFSKPFMNACDNNMIISVSAPITHSTNGAVVSGDIPILTFIDQIMKKKPSENGFLLVVDDNNDVLYHLKTINFENEAVSIEDPEFAAMIEKVVDNKGDFTDIKFRGEEGFGFMQNFPEVHLRIISFIPTRDISIYTIENLIIFHIIITIAFTFMFVILLFMRKIVIRPITDLRNKLGKLDFNMDFSDRILYRANNEFDSLVNSINNTLNRAQRAVEQRDDYKNKLKEQNQILEIKNEELFNEKELLDTLINNLMIGVTIWSSNDELITANSEFEAIVGYKQSEVPTLSIWSQKIYPEESYRTHVSEEWQKALQKREMTTRIFKIICKNGETKDVQYQVSFLRDGGYVMSITDMTERIRIEQDLIESEKRASEANVAKSEFLANMSHELRTPLNGIIGFSEVLENTVLSQKQIEYIDYINYSGKKLLKIISDILDFSKIEAGKIELEIMETDVYKIVKNCIKGVSASAEKKGIDLKLSVDEKLPLIYADPLRLYQVLGNLMSNAVKFTTCGSVELIVKCLHRTQDCITLKFSVKDTGIGIKPQQLERIFDSFTQADSSVTRRFGGTGLGLTISNNIIKQMNSIIQVESDPGLGSRFSFEITFDVVNKPKNNEAQITKKEDSNEKKQKMQTQHVIMIAEDDPINQKLTKIILRKRYHNITLLSAENGEKAYQIYLEQKPDLIIMDLQMPISNGFEVTKKIRQLEKNEKTKHIPIIAFTADATKKTIKTCVDSGMDNYVTKPAHSENLIQTIEMYL